MKTVSISTDHVSDTISEKSIPTEFVIGEDSLSFSERKDQTSSISSIDIYRLSGKIREAKYIKLPDKELYKNAESIEYFCTARLDNDPDALFCTQTTAKLSNPFWAEDFKLESKNEFKNVRVVLYARIKEIGSEISIIPVGKVVIPKAVVKLGQDCWFSLSDAHLEDRGTGQVELDINYIPPEINEEEHVFEVSVISAKDLFPLDGESLSNSYAYLHMLPQRKVKGMRTKPISGTRNPQFNEKFTFRTYDFDLNETSLHISFWNETAEGNQEFLGHSLLSLSMLMFQKKLKNWFPLRSLPDDKVLGCKKMTLKRPSFDENIHPVKTLLKSFSSPSSIFPSNHHRFFPLPSTVPSSCSQCSEAIVDNGSFCLECLSCIHSRCKDEAIACCGSVGAIKLSVNFVKHTALDVSSYQRIINLLKERDYEILSIVGKVSNHREEVAKTLLRIFDEHYIDFLKSILRAEIMSSPDSNTLFRANSIGSKAIDVFMKFVGQKYLVDTLERILREYAASQDPFELDTTRVGPGENLARNAVNLINMVESVTEAIFESGDKMPSPLKAVFKVIQESVMERFPDDQLVKYTSVSGFLFLRFFTPAILGPPLFHLNVGNFDEIVKRKFTLIAKTLQNLSNLAEFGKKEPFMEPLNGFINTKIPLMKGFLEYITENDVKYSMPSGKYPTEKISIDCADLIYYLESSLPKILSHTPASELAPHLEQELKKIEECRKNMLKRHTHSRNPSNFNDSIATEMPVMSPFDPYEDDDDSLDLIKDSIIVNRISGKLLEAKNFALPTAETFGLQLLCTGSIDSEKEFLFTSTKSTNCTNPFWAEYFKMDTINDINEAKFTLWVDTKKDLMLPIGKIVFPTNKDAIIHSNDDEWYSMADSSLEGKVSGSITVKISYVGEKEKRHEFRVLLQEAKDLSASQDIVFPFAVLHLFPDPNVLSTKQSNIHRNTGSPVFDESFTFFTPTSTDPSKLQLHISLWNDAGSEPFLGHCYVNLSTFTHGDVQKNVNLIALRDDSQVDLCVALSKLKSDKKKLYGKELASILQSPAKLSKYVEKSHLFNEKSQVLEQASKVFGNILLRIKYVEEKNGLHEIKVKLEEIKDLTVGADGAQFTIVMHVLPDPSFASTKKLKPQQLVSQTVLDQTFSFYLQKSLDVTQVELHLSLWIEDCELPFLGHLSIPLNSVISKKQQLYRWFPVQPITDAKDLSFLIHLQKAKLANHTDKTFGKELVKIIHFKRWGEPKNMHLTSDYFFKCKICQNIIAETPCLCADCFMTTHQHCSKLCTDSCGSYGAIKLRYNFAKLIVHDLDEYLNFITILKEDDYKVLRIFGKVSQQREEAARLLRSIFDSSYLHFVETVLLCEVRECNDHKTLFRGNSIGTKALESLIRDECHLFLKTALLNALRAVLIFARPFEIDPTRLTDQSLLPNNLSNLQDLIKLVIESIFSSVDCFPKSLQYLFSKIQAAAKIHFPFEESVKYSCVSGIIFNRFLNPAILSPNAFNINVGSVLDDVGKRKLVLVAKTLQNLSMLVDFGAKEAYMQSLNPLIQSYKPKMVTFLTQISSPIQEFYIPSKNENEFNLAKDCAELVEIISFSEDKIKSLLNGNLLSPRLEISLKLIHDKNAEQFVSSHASPFDSSHIMNSKRKSHFRSTTSSTGFLSRLASMSKHNSMTASAESSLSILAGPGKSTRVSHLLQTVPEIKIGQSSSQASSIQSCEPSHEHTREHTREHSHSRMASRQQSMKKSAAKSFSDLFSEETYIQTGKAPSSRQQSMKRSIAQSVSDLSPLTSRAVIREKGNYFHKILSSDNIAGAEKSERTGNEVLTRMIHNLAKITDNPHSTDTSVANLDHTHSSNNLLNLSNSEANLVSSALYFSVSGDNSTNLE